MADWRFRSRLVAYFDLILTGIGLVFIIIGLIGAALVFSDAKVRQDLEEKNPEFAGITVLLWIVLGFYLLACILQFYAALKLKSATEVGRDPGMAREMARTWMIITIVFMVYSVIEGIVKGTFILLVIGLIIRGLFLYAVHMFRLDLEQEMTRPSGMVGAAPVK